MTEEKKPASTIEYPVHNFDWASHILAVTDMMRTHLTKAYLSIVSMTRIAEFKDLRTFEFRAGRQNGKTTGIFEVARQKPGSVIFNGLTQEMHFSDVGSDGKGVITKVSDSVTMSEVLETVTRTRSEYLFLLQPRSLHLDGVKNYFADNPEKFSEKFITIVEG